MFEKGMAKIEGSGRQVGTGNKLNTDIKELFLVVLSEGGGKEWLAKWAKKHETAFFKVLAQFHPKEVHGTIEHKHEDFISMLAEERDKKNLEAGQPFKMIETNAQEMGSNPSKEAVSGEADAQKT